MLDNRLALPECQERGPEESHDAHEDGSAGKGNEPEVEELEERPNADGSLKHHKKIYVILVIKLKTN